MVANAALSECVRRRRAPALRVQKLALALASLVAVVHGAGRFLIVRAGNRVQYAALPSFAGAARAAALLSEVRAGGAGAGAEDDAGDAASSESSEVTGVISHPDALVALEELWLEGVSMPTAIALSGRVLFVADATTQTVKRFVVRYWALAEWYCATVPRVSARRKMEMCY